MSLSGHPITQITKDSYIGVYTIQTLGLGIVLAEVKEDCLIMRWKLPTSTNGVMLTMLIKLPEEFEEKKARIINEVEKLLNDKREQDIDHLNKCFNLSS